MEKGAVSTALDAIMKEIISMEIGTVKEYIALQMEQNIKGILLMEKDMVLVLKHQLRGLLLDRVSGLTMKLTGEIAQCISILFNNIIH